ncbi:MAG: hypothetical protein D6712_11095, partial [Chloroflexi bacterium]
QFCCEASTNAHIAEHEGGVDRMRLDEKHDKAERAVIINKRQQRNNNVLYVVPAFADGGKEFSDVVNNVLEDELQDDKELTN